MVALEIGVPCLHQSTNREGLPCLLCQLALSDYHALTREYVTVPQALLTGVGVEGTWDWLTSEDKTDSLNWL